MRNAHIRKDKEDEHASVIFQVWQNAHMKLTKFVESDSSASRSPEEPLGLGFMSEVDDAEFCRSIDNGGE